MFVVTKKSLSTRCSMIADIIGLEFTEGFILEVPNRKYIQQYVIVHRSTGPLYVAMCKELSQPHNCACATVPAGLQISSYHFPQSKPISPSVVQHAGNASVQI